MIILTVENIIPYLKENTDLLKDSYDMKVMACDGDTPESEGDGYINYIYRVEVTTKGEKFSFIVKQGREQSKELPMKLPVSRNKLEYKSIKLRQAIVPEYLPELYYIDEVNGIFIMEDCSELKILRYQLSRGNILEGVEANIASYLARSHFFSSEIYLTKETFRSLDRVFVNNEMRRVMEDGIFIPEYNPLEAKEHQIPYSDIYLLSRNIWEDDALVGDIFILRDSYMKNSQCLVHGDLHTSNIFVKDNRLKVIDMEYTSMGPYGYDIGYLLNNYISQYCAWLFRLPEEGKRGEIIIEYILASIENIFKGYVNNFDSLWDSFGKVVYSHSSEYRKALYRGILQDTIGFAAVANISRITMDIFFPDFQAIGNREKELMAKRLSLIISRYFILERNKYSSISQAIEDIKRISLIYLKELSH